MITHRSLISDMLDKRGQKSHFSRFIDFMRLTLLHLATHAHAPAQTTSRLTILPLMTVHVTRRFSSPSHAWHRSSWRGVWSKAKSYKTRNMRVRAKHGHTPVESCVERWVDRLGEDIQRRYVGVVQMYGSVKLSTVSSMSRKYVLTFNVIVTNQWARKFVDNFLDPFHWEGS